eukprot:CAMPEP_0181094768 /NCGR_PEP_ID=MMETSP1071-20121207/10166_1 /TAXON_ID=35127 /ORGANISM="Thalassiosira sp., Strain NH16" /LENGTH=336 /DNA_ID=CAMNT_0023177113 /DNA_START=1 /DNA_END=1012 /DNA_ORIENTATION=-
MSRSDGFSMDADPVEVGHNSIDASRLADGESIVSSSGLPQTSADFLASQSHSCSSAFIKHENDQQDSFYERVQSARHTTWTPGWEVATPRFNRSSNVTMDDGKNYYARVFDLLNWSRKQNLLPVLVNISSICHKGMELQHDDNHGRISMRELSGIDDESQSSPSLHACSNKFRDKTRTSTACIDMPGLLVANPNPPLKVNNPCHLQYRMVDGSHRLCLRKYLLTLLNRELRQLEKSRGETSTYKDIHDQIEQKQKMINQTSHGLFLVMNQTTFQSMLVNSNPHTSWARSREYLMKDFNEEVQLEWEAWMGRVMDRVFESKDEGFGDECIRFPNNNA